MNVLSEEFEAIVDRARSLIRVGVSGDTLHNAWDYAAAKDPAWDFAEALVALSESCVIGLPCGRHAGVVHGHEAEELRAGIERITGNTADIDEDDIPHVFRGTRKALIFLLDRIDARDSLAFREHTDPVSEPQPTH